MTGRDIDLPRLLAQRIPPIMHDPRTWAFHDDCQPRIWADCARCRQSYSLCQATESAIAQIMDGTWRCYPCSLEVVP